MSNVLEPIKKY